MNRLAGDHAEEQGEEWGQPGLGGRPVGQADGAQTDSRKEMLVSGRKLRTQRGLRGLEALETQTGTELGPASALQIPASGLSLQPSLGRP